MRPRARSRPSTLARSTEPDCTILHRSPSSPGRPQTVSGDLVGNIIPAPREGLQQPTVAEIQQTTTGCPHHRLGECVRALDGVLERLSFGCRHTGQPSRNNNQPVSDERVALRKPKGMKSTSTIAANRRTNLFAEVVAKARTNCPRSSSSFSLTTVGPPSRDNCLFRQQRTSTVFIGGGK